MITIVDYHMGNLLSIKNMLKKIGYKSEITADPDKIANAEKLILPGVGAFGAAMKNMEKLQLLGALNHSVLKNKTPILGICLGMQLMCNHSEEGDTIGLGWIDAEVKKIPNTIQGEKLKIPHIGWSIVEGKGLDYAIIDQENRFYFVHSFYVNLNQSEDLLLKSTYGVEFCSAFKKDNIMGVQFHPEKSHKFGMQLLKTFGQIRRTLE